MPLPGTWELDEAQDEIAESGKTPSAGKVITGAVVAQSDIPGLAEKFAEK